MRLVRATAALLLTGLISAGPSGWATHWQGDVPTRGRTPKREHRGGSGARRGGGAYLIAPAQPVSPSAWGLVWKSEAAAARVPLRGRVRVTTFVEQKSESARAEVWAAGGKLRLDYESGRRRWSLIDDGRSLIQLRPKSRRAVVLPRSPLAANKALAERNYVARTIGQATVAGRATQIVELAPRTGGPTAWRLWLDAATAVALRRDRCGPDGEVASSTEYLSVEFGVPIPPVTFSLPAGWKRVESTREGPFLSLKDLGSKAGFILQPPRYLPSGYAFQGGRTRHQGDRRGAPVPAAVELRYTDGLRVLSVFERELQGREVRLHRAPSGPSSRRLDGSQAGTVTVLRRGEEKAVRYLGSSLSVVAVGEVTEGELIRVAKSVVQGHDTSSAARRR